MGPDPALEWPSTLDVPALIASGWRPVPFREFIVKVHSRCDLACDYCYMFEMADQSWRGQPKRLSTDTAETTAKRIGEHGSGFANPSVYCPDLMRLIAHVGSVAKADLSARKRGAP
jgi:hypothetical protein